MLQMSRKFHNDLIPVQMTMRFSDIFQTVEFDQQQSETAFFTLCGIFLNSANEMLR